jgi:hypothetical protein
VAWSGAAEASPTGAPAGGGTKAGGGAASRRPRRRDRPRVVNSRYGAKQKDVGHFDFRGRGKNIFSGCMNSVKSPLELLK